MTSETQATELIVAAADLVQRCGAETFEMRFSDEQAPIVWIAVAGFRPGIHEVGAALTPEKAALRLLEALIDGGFCKHCKKPTGVVDDFTETPPMTGVCWYVYDPEIKRYRRSCE